MRVLLCAQHTAAADQPSQERITALPRGDERGQQGTGDSQSVPDLLTTAAHTQKNIYSEREREIDCRPVHSIPPKRRGLSMPQGMGYTDNKKRSLGKHLSHLLRKLIGCVISDLFLSSQFHCLDSQASFSLQCVM